MAFTLEADFLSRPARPASETGKRPQETDRNSADFKDSLAKLNRTGAREEEPDVLSRSDTGQTAVSAILVNAPQMVPEVTDLPEGELPDFPLIEDGSLTVDATGTELVPAMAEMVAVPASKTAAETHATAVPETALPAATEIPFSPDMASQKVSDPAAPLSDDAPIRPSDTARASGHANIESEVQAAPASDTAPLPASGQTLSGSTDRTKIADTQVPGTRALAAPPSQPAAQTPSGNTSGREQSGRDQSTTHISAADRELRTSTPQQAGTASFSDMVTTNKPAATQDTSAVAQPIPLHAQAPQPAAPPVPTAFTQTHALISATPAEVVDVISDSLAAPEDRKNRVIVQLDPPELGRISIDYKFDSHGLQHVTITGESPEAMRQLRLMHFELVNALEKQGLSSQNMSFQQHQANQDPGQQGSRSGQISNDIAENQALTVPALIASQTSQPGSESSGGLNIKL